MHRNLALAAALAALLPAQARADWQYTKWGMTPEEAVKASNGAMKLIPAKERKPVELTHTEPVAEGTYKDGALSVTVEFVIDTAPGRPGLRRLCGHGHRSERGAGGLARQALRRAAVADEGASHGHVELEQARHDHIHGEQQLRGHGHAMQAGRTDRLTAELPP